MRQAGMVSGGGTDHCKALMAEEPPRVLPVTMGMERLRREGSGREGKISEVVGVDQEGIVLRGCWMKRFWGGVRAGALSSRRMVELGRAVQRRAARTQPEVPAPMMIRSGDWWERRGGRRVRRVRSGRKMVWWSIFL